MIQSNLLLILIIIPIATTASTAPITSNFGDVFRSGEVAVGLSSGVAIYDFSIPYSSSLGSDSITLALSMVEYSQVLAVNDSNKISFRLLDNSPRQSNRTHGVFRASFGYQWLTTKARVKYLGCPTSLFSANFKIIKSEINPGTIHPHSSYSHHYTGQIFNVSEANSVRSAMWISGMQAWKKDGTYFSVDVSFGVSTPTIYIGTSDQITAEIYYGNITVTHIFFNQAATTTPSGYQLPYQAYSYGMTNQTELQKYNSWFDAANIICGIRNFYTSTSLLDYSIPIEGNKISVFSAVYSKCSNCWYSDISCFVAAAKLCPTTHPYYDESNNLCYDRCSGTSTSQYLCLPISCPAECLTCTTATTCTMCTSKYYLRSNQLCYSTCQDGFYPETNYLCLSNCSNGFDLSYNTCIQCPVGCSACLSQSFCSSCHSNFVLNSSSLCSLACEPGSGGCDEPITNSPSNFGMFVGAAVGGGVLLVVVVACCCRYHRREGLIEREPQMQKSSSASAGNIVIVEEWMMTKKGMDSEEECCICLDGHCSVLTSCRHRFHVDCIVSWCKKNASCPFCRSQLSAQKIEIYCKLCGAKKQLVSLKDLQEIEEKKITEKAELCQLCKTGQLDQ